MNLLSISSTLPIAKYMLSAVEHQKDVTNRNPAKEPRSARSILHRYSASSIAKARDPKWQGLRPTVDGQNPA